MAVIKDIDEMVRQAEIEEMEEKWSQRNKDIMAKYPTGDEPEGGAPENILPPGEGMEQLAASGDMPNAPQDADAAAEAAIRRAAPDKAPEHTGQDTSDEPGLPFGDSKADR